jgi:transposase
MAGVVVLEGFILMAIRYTQQFKDDAVALVDSGITQLQVCKDLGVSKTALQKWIRDAQTIAAGMTPSSDPTERREIAVALKRIRELEQENEVLRRAAAYLSQANLRTPK